MTSGGDAAQLSKSSSKNLAGFRLKKPEIVKLQVEFCKLNSTKTRWRRPSI